MDPEVVENVREVGKNLEDIGRMLQTKRKRWFNRSEIQDLVEALQLLTNTLHIYKKMIPKQ